MIRSFFVALSLLLLTPTVEAEINQKFRQKMSQYLGSYESQMDNNFRKARSSFLDGNHDSTIVYAGRFLDKKSTKKQLKNFALYFRGRAFREKGLFTEAAKDLSRISTAFPMKSALLTERADLFLLKSEFERALDLYLEVSSRDEQDQQTINIGANQHKIGICYLMTENYPKAEEYLLLAIERLSGDGDNDRLIASYGDLANVYYNQYLDDEAIVYFTKAYELAKESEDFDLKLTTAENMAVVEENRGDFEKSLEYRKEYDRWKDSLNNQRKVWEIAQIEKKHIAETKQREIGLLQRENDLKSQQRNGIMIGAGALLVVLVLLIYLYWQKIRSSAIIAEQRESLDKLNAFKNRLFSIVSHDLRSSVHGLRRSTEQLRDQIPQEDSELKSLVNQQGAMANSTFGMLDNLLNWALLQSDEIYFHREKISLKRLLPQVVMNYQPLLEQKKIELKQDIPADAKILADIDSTKIVLRNVLDNAIKFTPEGGSIHIVAENKDDHCVLRLKDSGSGMTAEQLMLLKEQSSRVSRESSSEASGTGLGVRLCTSFMLRNNGTFDIESIANQGTTVILSFQKA